MNISASIQIPSKETLASAEVVLSGWSPLGRVLVVGNDAAAREQNCELLKSLGYAAIDSTDALHALRQIATDASIGIVMVDLKMDGPNGLFLLNEIAERFMALRPIVTIAIGEAASDLTVEVMRAGASDLLVKPIAADSLSHSLRRATSRWSRQAQQFHAAAFGGPGADAPAKPAAPLIPRDPSFADLHLFGTKIIKGRQSRSQYIDGKLLNEAAWGILLDLAVAGLKGERVATSSACAAAQVPLSTALRHVNQLIQEGWVRRVGDPRDKRRTFLELQPRYFDVMVSYLRATWHLFGATAARYGQH